MSATHFSDSYLYLKLYKPLIQLSPWTYCIAGKQSQVGNSWGNKWEDSKALQESKVVK